MTSKTVNLVAGPAFRRPSFVGRGLRETGTTTASESATYFDSDDLRLARWDCTLRRAPRNRWIVGVEGSDVETFLDGDEPSEAAVQFLTAYLRGAILTPLVSVRMTQRLVTFATDDGDVVAIDEQRSSGTREGTRGVVRRLTVSARRRTGKTVASTVRLLRDAGARNDDGAPAYLAAASLEKPPPELSQPIVTARSSVADASRGALSASVIRLVRHDGPVRVGSDPEAVHQARVATRRLRSDLRTFGSLLDQAWAEGLRDELSELADDLGRVRDADVLLERLRDSAARLENPQDADQVIEALRESREPDRARLLEVLDDPRYLALLERLLQAATQPRIAGDGDAPAAEVLPPLVRKAWRRLRRRVRALPDNPSDAELHAIRIAAKRARYAAEAVAPVVGGDAERFAEEVAALQTHLGDFHDAIVAAGWLRQQTASDARVALVVGELIGMQLERAAELRASWFEVWRRASRKSLRGWM